MTSIYDLLGEDLEAPITRPRPRHTTLGLLGRPVLEAAASSGLIWALVRESGYLLPYPLFFLVFLALVVAVRIISRLRPPPAPELIPLMVDTPAPTLAEQPFAEARRWVRLLEGTRNDLERFRWAVIPAVRTLVDERLRLRYGITRHTHPDRAAKLLGPRLVEFLDSGPLRRVPPPVELSVLVKELEEL